jgi:hypothetical protein
MRPMVEAIFRDPQFFAEENVRAVIKGPAEYVVSCLKILDVKIPLRNLLPTMRRMGQVLFAPPSVKGWDGGAAWLTSATIFERVNYAMTVASTRGLAGEPRFEPKVWMRGRTLHTALELTDALADDVLHAAPSAETRAAIAEYLRPDPPPGDAKKKDEGKDKKPDAAAVMQDGMQSMQGAMADAPSPLSAYDARALDTKIRGAVRLLLASPEFQLS